MACAALLESPWPLNGKKLKAYLSELSLNAMNATAMTATRTFTQEGRELLTFGWGLGSIHRFVLVIGLQNSCNAWIVEMPGARHASKSFTAWEESVSTYQRLCWRIILLMRRFAMNVRAVWAQYHVRGIVVSLVATRATNACIFWSVPTDCPMRGKGPSVSFVASQQIADALIAGTCIAPGNGWVTQDVSLKITVKEIG